MLNFEYIWLDYQHNLRSKVKVLQELHDDDSSQVYDEERNDFITIKPKKIVPSPFSQDYYIILCDTWSVNDKYELIPHLTNTRHFCKKELQLHEDGNFFEFQQDFYIMDAMHRPFGVEGVCGEQNNYCKIGNGQIVGRAIMHRVMNMCKESKINVTQLNNENGFGQWSCKIAGYDIDVADQLIIFRYILSRVCEEYNGYPSFSPVPHIGFHPSGLKVSFHTNKMMKSYDAINHALKMFSKNHEQSLTYYGDNKQRLSRFHQTTFSFGISKHDVCVNIPNETYKNRKGHITDLRPASDANPYYIIQSIMEIIHKKD